MTWSYSASSTLARDTVRLLIGDTNPEDQLLQDEEIDRFLLMNSSDLLLAAADCAEALAARFAQAVVAAVGDYGTNLAVKSSNYFRLAARLRERARPEGETVAPPSASENAIKRPPLFSKGMTYR